MLYPRSQTTTERYRMIVFKPDASQVLLVPGGAAFFFPEVEIPAFRRVAEQLTVTMRCEWEQEIVCLFPLATEGSPGTTQGIRHYVAETLGPRDPVRGTTWVYVDSLNAQSFADASDHHALRRSVDRCCPGRPKSEGPFEKLAWFAEAKAWITEAIAPSGFHLLGPFRQLNASPTFSLIRFETTGPAVWFKAVGAPNIREFAIARELARFFPRFVPRHLASRDDWNAWLALEAEGRHPDERSTIETWTTVGKTLAYLQISSIGSTLHFLQTGVLDAGALALIALVDPFLDAMADLMKQQAKATPPPLGCHDLRALGEQLKSALIELENSGIPNTLGHLDFNLGNWLVNADRCIFLDWSEACVAHPFLTFQFLLEHVRRFHPHDPSWAEALLSSYLEPWSLLFPPDDITQALAVTPLLAAYAHAAFAGSWRESGSLRHATQSAHLRSLTRRMRREADVWRFSGTERSASCPS
jgi:Phosphotransferase enzyme family